jgi:hypothetical protein
MRRHGVSLSLAVATFAAAPAHATDFEISAHGGAFGRTQENDTLSSLGPVLGVAPMLRVNETVGIGFLFEYARLNWSEAALGGMPSASADRLLIAGVLRWYPLRPSAVDPYIQLAGGYVAHSRLPQAQGCTADMPIGVQLTGGIDAAVATWARIGGSMTVTGSGGTRGCVESSDDRRVLVEPGIGFSSQATFTTIWEHVL